MYTKVTNGTAIKYTLRQLRQDNPNTSFPKVVSNDILASYSVYPYTVTDRPAYDSNTQRCVEGVFEQDEQQAWTLPWVIQNQTQDETEANLRIKRDHALQSCDWIVIKHTDTGTTIPVAWTTYRQALRDITSHANWPNLVEADWPTKP
jgi:hypothetical protein